MHLALAFSFISKVGTRIGFPILVTVAALGVLSASGCAGSDAAGGKETKLNSPLPSEPGQGQPSGRPMRLPTPTIRMPDSPIPSSMPGFRTIVNEAEGFTLEVPADWQQPPDLTKSKIAVSSDGQVHASAYGIAEATNVGLDARLRDAIEFLTARLGISPTRSAPSTVTLRSGVEARTIELQFDRQGLARRLEVLVVGKRLLTYLLVFDSPSNLTARERTSIQNSMLSFGMFARSPYGIARTRGLAFAGDEPITLDPAISRENESHLYVSHLFSGLTRLNSTWATELDLAESVTIDETGTVYKFTLKPNLKFHNGDPITAYDVKYSIERATDPSSRSNTARLYLGDIIGAKAKLDGLSKSVAGVRVLSPLEVEIILQGPRPSFLSKLSYPVASIVDRKSTEQGLDWWKRKPLNGSGPFSLRTWDPGSVIVLERFNDYHRPSRLEYAIIHLADTPERQLYDAELLDIAFVGGDDLVQAREEGGRHGAKLHSYPQFTTYYVGFNTNSPPFDKLEVRQAFAQAIDLPSIIGSIFGTDVDVATGLVPRKLPGYTPRIALLQFDPSAAQTKLKKAGYNQITSLPEIVFSVPDQGEPHLLTHMLVESWRQHLGANVRIQSLRPDVYYYQLQNQLGALFRLAWVADYPSPGNFLEPLLHSGSVGQNYGGYANSEYDRLVEQAEAEGNPDQRAKFYQEAEQLAMTEAALIPLYHPVEYAIVRPHVNGFNLGPMGTPDLFNVSLSPEL